MKLKTMLSIFTFIMMSCSVAINWLTYIDNEKKYRISYPDTWEKKLDNGMAIFLSKKESKEDLFRENVNVMVQDLSAQPMTLEQYTNLTKEQIIKGAGSSAIQTVKDITLADQKAKEMIFIIPKNPLGSQIDLKIRQVWLIKNNKAFLITFTAEKNKYEKYLLEVTQTINTFKLL